MNNLSLEVLEIIFHNLPLCMRFKIAMLSKEIYEKVRHIPLAIKYDIDSNKGVESIGSFFFASVTQVNIIIDHKPVNYCNLKNMLASFYCLQYISITPLVSTPVVNKVTYCLPSSRAKNLELYCNSDNLEMFEAAVERSRKSIVVKTPESISKKRKIAGTRAEIDNILLPMKLAYEESQLKLQRLLEGGEKDHLDMPNSLVMNNLAITNDYKALEDGDLARIHLDDNINTLADAVAKKLVESIIMFEDSYLLVTEFEAYYRNNKDFDDCAQDSFWLVYPEQLEAHILKKNEKGNTWFEISIFWKRFEFLVTGGIQGSNNDNNIKPFLGPVINMDKPMTFSTNNKTRKVLIKKNEVDVVQFNRHLRQYNKASAKFKWQYKSKKFYDKGFTTTNPLEVYKNSSKTTMNTVSSFVLSRIAERNFTKQDINYTLNLLLETGLFPTIKNSTVLKFKNKTKKGSSRTNFNYRYDTNTISRVKLT